MKTPFLSQNIRCPYCQAPSVQVRFKAQVLVARKRDIDLRPMDYFWSVQGVQQVHPPLFTMWTCPKCLFTAYHDYFLDPFVNCAARLSRSQREADFDGAKKDWRESLIRLVAHEKFVEDYFERDHYEALQQNLLAVIWMESSTNLMVYDADTLGKYYLRLAWLLQEIEDEAGNYTHFVQPYRELIVQLQSIWKQAPLTSRDARLLAVDYCNRGIQTSTVELEAAEEVERWLLLVKILMMIPNYIEARRYLIKAQDERRRIAGKLESEIRRIDALGDNVRSSERNKMRSQTRKMEISFNEVKNIFDTNYGKWEAGEIERAKTAIKSAGKLSPEELKNFLANQGFPESVVAKMLIQDVKKGWMARR